MDPPLLQPHPWSAAQALPSVYFPVCVASVQTSSTIPSKSCHLLSLVQMHLMLSAAFSL